jgi:hypothetical protein
MKIVHRANDATTADDAAIIDVPSKKGTIAMSDQLRFDFARFEMVDPKYLKHERQKLIHAGYYFSFEIAKT